MNSAEEWSREFAELEAELDKMGQITPEKWEREFSELEAELDRMGLPLQAEDSGKGKLKTV